MWRQPDQFNNKTVMCVVIVCGGAFISLSLLPLDLTHSRRLDVATNHRVGVFASEPKPVGQYLRRLPHLNCTFLPKESRTAVSIFVFSYSSIKKQGRFCFPPRRLSEPIIADY